MESLFWDVSTPSSPSYAQHLSLQQISDIVRPLPQHIDAVKTLLHAYGISSVQLSLSGEYM